MADPLWYMATIMATNGGVDVFNMLWYRHEAGLVSSNYTEADLLADGIEADVLPELKAITPAQSVYTNIQVTSWYPDWSIATTPSHDHAISGNGGVLAALPGRSLCALFRASLVQPPLTSRLDGHNVTRGRIFVGPLWDAVVGDTDAIVTSAFPAGTLAAFMTAAAATLTVATSHQFKPIRVSGPQLDAAGAIVSPVRSAAYVSSWTLRTKSSKQWGRTG